MNTHSTAVYSGITALLALALSATAMAGAQVDRGDGCNGPNSVLVGLDNDNFDNRTIQPANVGTNQSLNNADVLLGGGGCDILIGLQGNDVLDGGDGRDIMIGGTEQFDPEGFGNRDVMIGGAGGDINIWAPGDGSDAYLGGPGRDAMVFGIIDRDADNVPTLSPTRGRFEDTGLPSANVSGSPGFCRIEDVRHTDLGFDYLVRFFVRSTGNLAVTIRLKDVEQVFCTSEAGGNITFANLAGLHPLFVNVDLHQVAEANRIVSKIIR